MIYQTQKPAFPLCQFISHFTYYKNYNPDHRIDRFLPDGNIEVVMDLSDSPKYIYHNESLAEIQACRRTWISGIRTGFITIPSGKDSEMFIINFRKGMAYPFLNMPMMEISNRVVQAELILHPIFATIRSAVANTADVSYMFMIAEQQLVSIFANKLQVNPFIDFAVNKIISAPEICTIKKVADKTGFSSKHFITVFKQHVGTSPKTFLRILRFQKAVCEMENTGHIRWAGLANECGYFDQAHFISDFKTFSGFTPLEYMKKKNGFLNYVPVS